MKDKTYDNSVMDVLGIGALVAGVLLAALGTYMVRSELLIISLAAAAPGFVAFPWRNLRSRNTLKIIGLTIIIGTLVLVTAFTSAHLLETVSILWLSVVAIPLMISWIMIFRINKVG